MNSEKRLALFGATGSIGRQTLDVIEHIGGYKVAVLSAGKKADELADLALKWKPDIVTIADYNGYKILKDKLGGSDIRIEVGDDAASGAAEQADYNICVNGLVGVAGLLPSYHALKRGITLALANKESLVLAGEILNKISRVTGAKILPIDSEHSAIWQCLRGENVDDVARLILTASGGPFRETPIDEIKNANVAQALKHPTWKMGRKITIDSATLMNKGLEVIEAYHLFGITEDKIDVRIHPVSIVHSMVEFVDGSFKAQLGTPDMRHPIAYALGYPGRLSYKPHDDDPINWPAIEFSMVEEQRYPCLYLAFKALRTRGMATAVLNGADEAAVELFLDGRIKFGDISRLVDMALNAHIASKAEDIEQVIEADSWARRFVTEQFKGI
ncbi:1-deoxy-D-xylulose-5-phosphate reductoisomerase [bacterium]|nr:1-deoxy-D-xylulose-5-phosphate reductoisomerase [bacterium]